MRSRFLVGVFLALIGGGYTGCNWGLLLAFKAQMRAVRENTAWEGAEKEILVFKKPLLTRQDLEELNIFPETLDANSAVLRYRGVDSRSGMPADFEIRLLFANAKLSGIIFPAMLRESLERERITALFGMMGGDDSPSGAGAIPKTRILSTKLLLPSAQPLDGEVELLWMPADTRNRPINIKLKERAQMPGFFSDILIGFKDPREAGK